MPTEEGNQLLHLGLVARAQEFRLVETQLLKSSSGGGQN